MNARNSWYVAELLVLSQIGGPDDLVLANNFVLVSALDAQCAIKEAHKIGEGYTFTYINTDNKKVEQSFLGLRNLHFVHDELANGAELLWERFVPTTEQEAKRFIREESEFSACRDESKSPVANPADVSTPDPTESHLK